MRVEDCNGYAGAVARTNRVSLPITAILGVIAGFTVTYALDCLLAMTYWQLWNQPGAFEQIFFHNEYAQVKGYFGALTGMTAGITLGMWANGKRWTAGWANLAASVGLFLLAALWVIDFMPRYMHRNAPIGYVAMNIALVVVPMALLFVGGVVCILMGPTAKHRREAAVEPLANPHLR